MAAPKGNKFWKIRSKHGRDKLFTSSSLLWDAACEYFEWCEKNPLIEVEQVKAQGRPVKDKEGNWVFPPNVIRLPKVRAFTLQGLCHYLDCNAAYFRVFKSQLPKGEEDFNTVITRIEETIYNQKYVNAAAGFLNANLISRDLGLAEKTQQDLSIIPKEKPSWLTDDVVNPDTADGSDRPNK